MVGLTGRSSGAEKPTVGSITNPGRARIGMDTVATRRRNGESLVPPAASMAVFLFSSIPCDSSGGVDPPADHDPGDTAPQSRVGDIAAVEQHLHAGKII